MDAEEVEKGNKQLLKIEGKQERILCILVYGKVRKTRFWEGGWEVEETNWCKMFPMKDLFCLKKINVYHFY